MARSYADENFDRASVQALIALGHDVLTVQQAGLRGSTDPEVLAFAKQDNRAVLTSRIPKDNRVVIEQRAKHLALRRG